MAKCRKLLKNRYTGNNYTTVSILCMLTWSILKSSFVSGYPQNNQKHSGGALNPSSNCAVLCRGNITGTTLPASVASGSSFSWEGTYLIGEFGIGKRICSSSPSLSHFKESTNLVYHSYCKLCRDSSMLGGWSNGTCCQESPLLGWIIRMSVVSVYLGFFHLIQVL